MRKRTMLFTIFSLAISAALAVLNTVDLVLQIKDR